MNERKKNAANQLARECMATALVQLLREKPLSAITVSEITQRAGVSRMTYYRNYKKKEDIFLYNLDDLMDEYHREFQHLPQGTTYCDEVNICHCFSYFQKHSDFISALFYSGLGHMLLDALSRYVINYWHCPKDGPGKYYTLLAFSGSLFNTYMTWATHGKKETPEEMARILSSVYKKGPA